jgi:hypothetical protein
MKAGRGGRKSVGPIRKKYPGPRFVNPSAFWQRFSLGGFGIYLFSIILFLFFLNDLFPPWLVLLSSHPDAVPLWSSF